MGKKKQVKMLNNLIEGALRGVLEVTKVEREGQAALLALLPEEDRLAAVQTVIAAASASEERATRSFETMVTAAAPALGAAVKTGVKVARAAASARSTEAHARLIEAEARSTEAKARLQEAAAKTANAETERTKASAFARKVAAG